MTSDHWGHALEGRSGTLALFSSLLLPGHKGAILTHPVSGQLP
jgi:hypothetical protein